MKSTTLPIQPAIELRPMRSDDIDVVETVFAGLSDRSRYLRFHGSVPRLSGPLRRMLLDVDGHDRLVLLAETPIFAEPVGTARLVRTGPDEAEIAVAVVDTWHRRGVGRALLTALRAAAEARGITWLTVQTLAENHPVQNLIHAVFPRCTTQWDDGALRITCSLHDDATASVLDHAA